MKYKVSLLPEDRKKRIQGKKKVEKIRAIALTVILVVFALFILVFATKMYSDKKLSNIEKENEEYARRVSELSSYREINAELEAKINLIDSIQVEEPYLEQFLVDVGNISRPGVSFTSIECSDWKSVRKCVISGTCDNRRQYLDLEESFKKLEGVNSVVCTSFLSEVGTEDGRASFTVELAAKGGIDINLETIPAFEGYGTTEVDENAGVNAE